MLYIGPLHKTQFIIKIVTKKIRLVLRYIVFVLNYD